LIDDRIVKKPGNTVLASYLRDEHGELVRWRGR